MSSFTASPLEIQLNILSYLAPEDLVRCKLVSRRFAVIADAFPFDLQRIKCHCEAVCGSNGNLRLVVQKAGNMKTLEVTPESLKKLEVTELLVTSENNSTDNHDAAVIELIRVLQTSRQTNLRIVTVRDLRLETSVLAQQLLDFVCTGLIQEINLNNVISQALSAAHIGTMDSLCQARVAGAKLETADALINKLTKDMRFKPRLNVPFIAEGTACSPEAVATFLREWIHLPESPYFQYKLVNCDAVWRARLAEECERQALSHVFYEFPSVANPLSHIKIKFHEDTNECVLFPIKDVPARSPVSPYVCFARYFRDF
uniref:F-box domain-containing protein n=1 Tax=Panagrellus redivivus TaxID=6233 RepID=A0A7E4VFF9_PANRE